MRAVFLSLIALPILGQGISAEGCGNTEDPPVDCERPAASADRVRRVVISRPYDSRGSAANVWEVLQLDTAGKLSTTGVTFEMGRAADGKVVFTPDGKVGMVSQEDGTLGVFRFNEDGSVTVVYDGYEGSFYAGGPVVMDPSGQRAWVLDTNWRENGGGIYSVHVYCDGRLEDEGLQAASKLPYALEYLHDGSGDAVLAATDVLSSSPGDDMHRVSLGGAVTLEDGSDAFGDDGAIVSSLAVTFDGRYGLVGDNNMFSGTGNRVGVVDLTTMSRSQVLSSVEDPVGLLASPYNNAALVVSGFGDAIFRMSYTPGASNPFAVKGELTYSGGRPQLPSTAVMIEQGSLTGLALIAENSGVRRVRFQPDGSITDLGLFSLGSGYTAIPGALGVEP